MTLEEIEDSLPNGLHDAHITNISLDYIKREATLSLEICFSEHDREGPEEYRMATLLLSGLLYLIIEAPDANYPYQEGKALRVDAGSGKPESAVPTRLPEPLPEGAFVHWFFVNSWNSFIHVAALSAKIVVH